MDWLLLAVVLAVAAFLRLYKVESLPAGPYYDEAANGILASEIASGVSRPLFIPSYTGKEVLFFYVAAAMMKITGATLLGLRLASVLLGVAGVAVAYVMALTFFDADEIDDSARLTRRATALLTATLAATSFWHINMSRYGFRAMSQPLTQALMLLFLWRGLRNGRRLDVVVGGLFCGMTAYTYLASRAVPLALLPLLLGMLLVDRERQRQRAVQAALFVLSALVIFAPLGVYFLQHPQAFSVRMSQVSVLDPSVSGSDLCRTVAQSAWRALLMFTARGDPLWRFGVPGKPVFPILIAILFYLGLLVSLVKILRSQDGPVRVLHLSLLLWLPIMLVPSILGANREEVPSSLRAIGVMPVLYLFPAQGLATMLALVRRWCRVDEDVLTGVVSVILLLGSAASVFQDYFDIWGHAPQPYYGNDNDLADAARALNRLDLGKQELFVSSVHYRHPTMAFLARDYPRMRWIGTGQTLPLPPTEGSGAVYVFPRSALPDATLLKLLGAVASAERHLGPDGNTAYLLYRLPADTVPAISPQYSLIVNFGHQIELLGYDLAPAAAGESLAVTLYWHVLAPTEVGDYAVFAHLLDAWGFRWGSSDVFDYPSAEWATGQVIVQRRFVSVPTVAPPGDYELAIGFYSQGQDARLPRFDGQGRVAGTTVMLGPVAVDLAPTPPPVEELTVQQPLLAEFDALRLLGYERDRTSVRQGEALHLGLYWQAASSLADLVVSLNLRSEADGKLLPLWEGRPVHGTYPTDQWAVGTVVLDRYGLTVHHDAPPGEYTLLLAVREHDGGGQSAGEVVSLAELRVESVDRRTVVPPIQHPLRANLGDRIEFLGYDLDRRRLAPGETLDLTLYWRALTAMDASYTVFTHLLDEANQIWAQQDNPPVSGTYPTTLWVSGEVVVDEYELVVKADAPPGEYVVEIGLYVAETGQRLPVLDDIGQIVGDRILLGQVQVKK
jgi:hypothetical protein